MDYTELLPPLPELPEPDSEMTILMAGREVLIDTFRPSTVVDFSRAYALAAIAAAAPAIRRAERARAAAACERFAADIAPSGTSHPQCDAMSEGAYQCAAAIRALPERAPNVAGNRLAEGKSELTGLLGVPARSEKE